MAGKLTFGPSDRTDVVLSIVGDPARHHAAETPPIFGSAASTFVSIDPFLALGLAGGVRTSLRLRRQMRPNLSLEVLLTDFRERFGGEGRTETWPDRADVHGFR